MPTKSRVGESRVRAQKIDFNLAALSREHNLALGKVVRDILNVLLGENTPDDALDIGKIFGLFSEVRQPAIATAWINEQLKPLNITAMVRGFSLIAGRAQKSGFSFKGTGGKVPTYREVLGIIIEGVKEKWSDFSSKSHGNMSVPMMLAWISGGAKGEFLFPQFGGNSNAPDFCTIFNSELVAHGVSDEPLFVVSGESACVISLAVGKELPVDAQQRLLEILLSEASRNESGCPDQAEVNALREAAKTKIKKRRHQLIEVTLEGEKQKGLVWNLARTICFKMPDVGSVDVGRSIPVGKKLSGSLGYQVCRVFNPYLEKFLEVKLVIEGGRDHKPLQFSFTRVDEQDKAKAKAEGEDKAMPTTKEIFKAMNIALMENWLGEGYPLQIFYMVVGYAVLGKLAQIEVPREEWTGMVVDALNVTCVTLGIESIFEGQDKTVRVMEGKSDLLMRHRDNITQELMRILIHRLPKDVIKKLEPVKVGKDPIGRPRKRELQRSERKVAARETQEQTGTVLWKYAFLLLRFLGHSDRLLQVMPAHDEIEVVIEPKLVESFVKSLAAVFIEKSLEFRSGEWLEKEGRQVFIFDILEGTEPPTYKEIYQHLGSMLCQEWLIKHGHTHLEQIVLLKNWLEKDNITTQKEFKTPLEAEARDVLNILNLGLAYIGGSTSVFQRSGNTITVRVPPITERLRKGLYGWLVRIEKQCQESKKVKVIKAELLPAAPMEEESDVEEPAAPATKAKTKASVASTDAEKERKATLMYWGVIRALWNVLVKDLNSSDSKEDRVLKDKPRPLEGSSQLHHVEPLRQQINGYLRGCGLTVKVASENKVPKFTLSGDGTPTTAQVCKVLARGLYKDWLDACYEEEIIYKLIAWVLEGKNAVELRCDTGSEAMYCADALNILLLGEGRYPVCSFDSNLVTLESALPAEIIQNLVTKLFQLAERKIPGFKAVSVPELVEMLASVHDTPPQQQVLEAHELATVTYQTGTGEQDTRKIQEGWGLVRAILHRVREAEKTKGEMTVTGKDSLGLSRKFAGGLSGGVVRWLNPKFKRMGLGVSLVLDSSGISSVGFKVGEAAPTYTTLYRGLEELMVQNWVGGFYHEGRLKMVAGWAYTGFQGEIKLRREDIALEARDVLNVLAANLGDRSCPFSVQEKRLVVAGALAPEIKRALVMRLAALVKARSSKIQVDKEAAVLESGTEEVAGAEETAGQDHEADSIKPMALLNIGKEKKGTQDKFWRLCRKLRCYFEEQGSVNVFLYQPINLRQLALESCSEGFRFLADCTWFQDIGLTVGVRRANVIVENQDVLLTFSPFQQRGTLSLKKRRGPEQTGISYRQVAAVLNKHLREEWVPRNLDDHLLYTLVGWIASGRSKTGFIFSRYVDICADALDVLHGKGMAFRTKDNMLRLPTGGLSNEDIDALIVQLLTIIERRHAAITDDLPEAEEVIIEPIQEEGDTSVATGLAVGLTTRPALEEGMERDPEGRKFNYLRAVLRGISANIADKTPVQLKKMLPFSNNPHVSEADFQRINRDVNEALQPFGLIVQLHYDNLKFLRLPGYPGKITVSYQSVYEEIARLLRIQWVNKKCTLDEICLLAGWVKGGIKGELKCFRPQQATAVCDIANIMAAKLGVLFALKRTDQGSFITLVGEHNRKALATKLLPQIMGLVRPEKRVIYQPPAVDVPMETEEPKEVAPPPTAKRKATVSGAAPGAAKKRVTPDVAIPIPVVEGVSDGDGAEQVAEEAVEPEGEVGLMSQDHDRMGDSPDMVMDPTLAGGAAVDVTGAEQVVGEAVEPGGDVGLMSQDHDGMGDSPDMVMDPTLAGGAAVDVTGAEQVVGKAVEPKGDVDLMSQDQDHDGMGDLSDMAVDPTLAGGAAVDVTVESPSVLDGYKQYVVMGWLLSGAHGSLVYSSPEDLQFALRLLQKLGGEALFKVVGNTLHTVKDTQPESLQALIEARAAEYLDNMLEVFGTLKITRNPKVDKTLERCDIQNLQAVMAWMVFGMEDKQLEMPEIQWVDAVLGALKVLLEHHKVKDTFFQRDGKKLCFLEEDKRLPGKVLLGMSQYLRVFIQEQEAEREKREQVKRKAGAQAGRFSKRRVIKKAPEDTLPHLHYCYYQIIGGLLAGDLEYELPNRKYAEQLAITLNVLTVHVGHRGRPIFTTKDKLIQCRQPLTSEIISGLLEELAQLVVDGSSVYSFVGEKLAIPFYTGGQDAQDEEELVKTGTAGDGVAKPHGFDRVLETLADATDTKDIQPVPGDKGLMLTVLSGAFLDLQEPLIFLCDADAQRASVLLNQAFRSVDYPDEVVCRARDKAVLVEEDAWRGIGNSFLVLEYFAAQIKAINQSSQLVVEQGGSAAPVMEAEVLSAAPSETPEIVADVASATPITTTEDVGVEAVADRDVVYIQGGSPYSQAVVEGGGSAAPGMEVEVLSAVPSEAFEIVADVASATPITTTEDVGVEVAAEMDVVYVQGRSPYSQAVVEEGGSAASVMEAEGAEASEAPSVPATAEGVEDGRVVGCDDVEGAARALLLLSSPVQAHPSEPLPPLQKGRKRKAVETAASQPAAKKAREMEAQRLASICQITGWFLASCPKGGLEFISPKAAERALTYFHTLLQGMTPSSIPVFRQSGKSLVVTRALNREDIKKLLRICLKEISPETAVVLEPPVTDYSFLEPVVVPEEPSIPYVQDMVHRVIWRKMGQWTKSSMEFKNEDKHWFGVGITSPSTTQAVMAVNGHLKERSLGVDQRAADNEVTECHVYLLQKGGKRPYHSYPYGILSTWLKPRIIKDLQARDVCLLVGWILGGGNKVLEVTRVHVQRLVDGLNVIAAEEVDVPVFCVVDEPVGIKVLPSIPLTPTVLTPILWRLLALVTKEVILPEATEAMEAPDAMGAASAAAPSSSIVEGVLEAPAGIGGVREENESELEPAVGMDTEAAEPEVVAGPNAMDIGEEGVTGAALSPTLFDGVLQAPAGIGGEEAAALEGLGAMGVREEGVMAYDPALSSVVDSEPAVGMDTEAAAPEDPSAMDTTGEEGIPGVACSAHEEWRKRKARETFRDKYEEWHADLMLSSDDDDEVPPKPDLVSATLGKSLGVDYAASK